MLLEIEVENLQNTLTEVSKMRQYSVSLFPEFDSYFWAKDRPDLSLSQKIFTVNVA